jgi:hypothetical protein
MTYAPVIRFRSGVYQVYLSPSPGMGATQESIDEGPFGPYTTRAEASAALERLLSERWHSGVALQVAGTSHTDVASAMSSILTRANEV